tara:strand:+ start:1118 stop:1729 length:612 start_codon:yes stop_codon:yes gene_type:complete
MRIEDLLNGKAKEQLFDYSPEEVTAFHEGFDPSYIKAMFETIDKCVDVNNSYNEKLQKIIDYLCVLSEEDLNTFEKEYIDKHTETNPNMLWNMLSKYDKALYKTPDKFYEWFSKVTDRALDTYIYRAADGKKLHPDYVYEKDPATKVEILDGFIAISSVNLKALDKFKDRVLASNDCSFEHRIKMHEGVKVHSYVFNINDKNN